MGAYNNILPFCDIRAGWFQEHDRLFGFFHTWIDQNVTEIEAIFVQLLH